MPAAPQLLTDVLIVDDDESTRQALQMILEANGFRTAGAANGREALNYLRRNPPPRVILLDLMMPVMNGWEFRTLQRRDPALADIPVVVFSAVGDIEEEAALIGAAHSLHKPIDPDQLVNTVRYYQQQKNGSRKGS
jgi:CheY-like chemotaxis protein